MNDNAAAKIYEWMSYVLIVGATVVFFATGKKVDLTLLILVVAVYMRVMMYRTRLKSFESENQDLRNDLRKLTQLLREKEQK